MREGRLQPGSAVRWVGAAPPPPEQDLVRPGEQGVVLSDDGSAPDDGYVVVFPGGRIFCCAVTDVRAAPQSRS